MTSIYLSRDREKARIESRTNKPFQFGEYKSEEEDLKLRKECSYSFEGASFDEHMEVVPSMDQEAFKQKARDVLQMFLHRHGGESGNRALYDQYKTFLECGGWKDNDLIISGLTDHGDSVDLFINFQMQRITISPHSARSYNPERIKNTITKMKRIFGVEENTNS